MVKAILQRLKLDEGVDVIKEKKDRILLELK
jgi:hypothetical protein